MALGTAYNTLERECNLTLAQCIWFVGLSYIYMAKSRVETVLGAINAEDLGLTLPHEHVVMDCSYCCTQPATDEERERYNAPITMQNLNWLRHNLYKSKVNVSMYNEQEAVITDLKIFKQAGGATVVENTVIGINRDIIKMVNISKSSGVHMVCGTGYFVDETVPGEVKSLSVEKITQVWGGGVEP